LELLQPFGKSGERQKEALMATAPQTESYYCSDPNCLYCKDLRLATEQMIGDWDLAATAQRIKPQKEQ
jgi:hypothetical protein